jgi:hypothetical protein
VRRLKRTKPFELVCWSQILGILYRQQGYLKHLRPSTADRAAGWCLQKNNLSLRLKKITCQSTQTRCYETIKKIKKWIFWRIVGSNFEQEAKGAAKKTWDVFIGCIYGCLTFEIKAIIRFINCNQAGTYVEITSQLQVLNVVVNRLLRYHQRPPKAAAYWVAFGRWPCF